MDFVHHMYTSTHFRIHAGLNILGMCRIFVFHLQSQVSARSNCSCSSVGPKNFTEAAEHVAERLGEAVPGDAAAAGLGAVGGGAPPLILLLLLVHHVGLLLLLGRRVPFGFVV